MFDKIKESVYMFLSRVWVRILYMSSPAQSGGIKEIEELKHKEARKLISITKLIRLVIAFLIIFLFSSYVFVISPPDGFPVDKLITIKKGVSAQQVADELYTRKVIRSKEAFLALLKLTGNHNKIKSGDYLFKRPLNLFEVEKYLSQGIFGLEPVRITIPEGSTVEQIASVLEKNLLRFDKEKFIKLAKKDEGYLFPDTYFFMPNATEEEVYRAMKSNFTKKIKKLEPLIKKFNRPLEDIVKMASIVEKESWKHYDRRLIAGVLWRRLKLGIPLQVDATFVYTHNKGSSQITIKELADESNPYNTYVHKGLPPTPIGNPGLSAIKATITPIDKGYLYYLADKYGNTYFSHTYKEHLEKRNKYINW